MSFSQSIINTYFDRIFIINLKHRTDRWSKMIQKLEKYGITNYERFDAIDPKNPPYNKLYGNLPFFFESKGALGVLLSAFMIIKTAKVRGYKSILIFEDDVIFHKTFNKIFTDRISKIPNKWKLLFLGCSMHKWRYSERCKIVNDFYYPRGSIPGAFALAIHSSAYDTLLGQLTQIRGAWDMYVLKYVNTIFRDQCLVFKPNIVIADPTDSNIRAGKSMKYKASTCNWNLKEYDI
jgi:GR25 family glycosyltransferase involved in LPS biosynthesis